MLTIIGRLAVIAGAVLAGWLLACVVPPPDALVERINPQVVEQRLLSLRERIVRAGGAAGQLIVVERVSNEDLASGADIPDWAMGISRPSPDAAAGSQVPQLFEANLNLCPGMTVSNAPRANSAGAVTTYSPVVDIDGVALAVNPSRGACLASGFGPRGQRSHRGLDYHSSVGGEILAAAAGTVLEMKYRDDFGNMLLIDHGAGVYTRYAHLSAFQGGLAVGSRVSAGDVIGLMGNTAGYAIPIHLHYEVLLGDYANPRASFGLEAVDPLDYAPAQGG